MIAYLDTQSVVFLSQGNAKLFTRDAQRSLRQSELFISPLVLVELEILNEIQRVKPSGRDILRQLQHDIGLRICDLPFQTVADIARDESWTRDPFDRIIVAQAKARGFADLISSDTEIKQHYPRTVW